jgi:type II secretory pathway component PulJ
MRRSLEESRAVGCAGLPRAAGVTLIESILATSLSVILLTSLVSLYVGAVKTVTREEKRSETGNSARIVTSRLERDLTMVGLDALEDIDGDSNDIRRDVRNQTWSDSIFAPFEYARTYELVTTADVDADSITETIRYYLDTSTHRLLQQQWEWRRDSLAWSAPTTRTIASDVDLVLFDYYDNEGTRIPDQEGYPTNGFTLTFSERGRITAVQVSVVTRSDERRLGRTVTFTAPDGQSWTDRYDRRLTTFMLRGRNLGRKS